MNHTLRSRVSILLVTVTLASSPATAQIPAMQAARELPIASSILSSLWDFLDRLVPAIGKSAGGAPDGQTQPTSTASGSETGDASGTGSDDGDRGSGMDPNG